MLVKVTLLDATAIATDTTTVGGTVDLSGRAGTAKGVLGTITSYSAGDFDCDIETSPDGTNWMLLCQGQTGAADGIFFDAVNGGDVLPPDAFRYVRASVLSATSADATVKVELILGHQ